MKAIKVSLFAVCCLLSGCSKECSQEKINGAMRFRGFFDAGLYGYYKDHGAYPEAWTHTPILTSAIVDELEKEYPTLRRDFEEFAKDERNSNPKVYLWLTSEKETGSHEQYWVLFYCRGRLEVLDAGGIENNPRRFLQKLAEQQSQAIKRHEHYFPEHVEDLQRMLKDQP